MPSTQANADVFWLAFQALSKKERETVVERLLQDREFREDVIDLALLEKRQKEPARKLGDYLSARRNRH